MKKVLILGLLILPFICTTAFAGGVGNPIQPLKTTTDRYGTGVAFGYNYVGSRLMQLFYYGDERFGNVRIKHVSQLYGQIPYGLNDNMNVYARIGTANYKLTFRDGNYDETVKVNLKTGVYGGLGLNALYPLKTIGDCAISWGYDIQAGGYLNDVYEMLSDERSIQDAKGYLYGVDGQNSLYLTCKYEIEKLKTSIIPYIGAYHSWIVVGTINPLEYTRNKGGSGETSERTELFAPFDALSFGLLCGFDVEVTKFTHVNVEGRFIGETAITVVTTVKF